MNMLLGRKIGMTQIFDKDGIQKAVTVIEVGPCLITQVKTKVTDGYNAIQLGFGKKKEKHTTKSMQGHFKAANADPLRFLREVRVEDASKYELGKSVVLSDIFQEGDTICVSGISKGKGFQGVVKRYHFAGGPKTHGQSDRHRARGSIGQNTFPGRVFKNLRMAGKMGKDRVTLKNLKIEKIFAARNLMLIGGALPGGKNAILEVCKI